MATTTKRQKQEEFKDAFENILYDFISKLPYRVKKKKHYYWDINSSVEVDFDFELQRSSFGGDTYSYYRLSDKVCIPINREYYYNNPYGRYFLYIPLRNVLIGDGWIAVRCNSEISLYLDNTDLLVGLFSQYLEKEQHIYNDFFINEFERPNYLGNGLECVDTFLKKYEGKEYIFNTYISRNNFIKLCGNAELLTFGGSPNGELIWDLPSFVFRNYNILFNMTDALKEFVFYENYDFSSQRRIEKKLKSIQTDDDNMNLVIQNSLLRIKSGIQEITAFQCRLHKQFISDINNGNRVFVFIENADHFSDEEIILGGTPHKSFLIVQHYSSIYKTEYMITLKPSNKRYSDYSFYVEKESLDEALITIVGFFSSRIKNKRQLLRNYNMSKQIREIFSQFGIRHYTLS